MRVNIGRWSRPRVFCTAQWCVRSLLGIYLLVRRMHRTWRGRPFAVRKMEQLWRLVRESHEMPMSGTSRPVELLRADELGVTFIGHSSFLLQVNGRKLLVDPVFSKRLIVL